MRTTRVEMLRIYNIVNIIQIDKDFDVPEVYIKRCKILILGEWKLKMNKKHLGASNHFVGMDYTFDLQSYNHLVDSLMS